jgi:hypothetical protein
MIMIIGIDKIIIGVPYLRPEGASCPERTVVKALKSNSDIGM